MTAICQGTPATSSTNCWCEWSRPWPTSPSAARTSRCARPAAPSTTCARRSSWPGKPAARHPTSAAWLLAFLVARHKLLPRDPLHLEGWTDQAELLARVVGEVPLSQAEAMQLLPA